MTKEELYKKKLEPYFQGEDGLILDQLLEHAAYLYKSLYRYSGESYFLRALRLTCDKILKLRPDRATIMATVLISACYSPRCDLDKIEKLFGLEVRKLVESLGKINAIKSRYTASDTKILSKMFLSLADDLRVIIIRLADRIENMETLQFKSVEKQKANAREILEVYVPIASRLGLYEFKLTLEDLAFKYVFPDEYRALKRELDEYLSFSKKTIDEIKKELKDYLFKNGFKVEVSGRIKNLFSIYKKMKKKTATLLEIYDIYAMRVVLKSDPNKEDVQDDIEKLYKILSLLHSKYQNLPERFKDYVTNPKPNGYRSLHTALVGLNAQNNKNPTEIQIRTAAMHNFSENGFAAHWLYKETHLAQDEGFIRALRDLRANTGRVDSSTAVLKMNLYQDRVFVLTPDNLVKELPVGATPIDFAFAIHSDIGHRCSLAKINGAVVPLDYQLKNGDIIEIITSNKINTKLSWLESVRTKQARNRIKNYFRTLDKDSLLDQGKEEFNLLLEKVKMEKLDESLSVLKNYKNKSLSLKEREELMEELGAGNVTAGTIFRNAFGKSADILLSDKIKTPARIKKGIIPKHNKSIKSLTASQILLIGGEKGVPYRIATCCKPKISDQIVAYVTKNRGVSVHKIKCSFVSTAKPDRLLMAGLSSELAEDTLANKYQVSLNLQMEAQGNTLLEVVKFCEQHKITILGFSTLKKEENLASRQFIVDILDGDDLQSILRNLEHLNGVIKVAKV